MGTTWTVKIVPPTSRVDEEGLNRRVLELLETLEQQFSTYRPSSEISRFNANGSADWFPVSSEIAGVTALSHRISELTGGAFDVTVAPLLELWGFGAIRRTSAPPEEAAIAAVREKVGWRGLETRANPPALRKAKAEMAVDFSSLVKGYAADALGRMLASLGLSNHFVQIGGDVKTGGSGPQGEGWRVGIEEPREAGRAIACVVTLAGQAVSTSGNYRNFVVLAGKRHGHILDPRSGRPVDSGLAGISVVHPSCAWSSALATGLFVLGAEEGFRLAERENLACLFLVIEQGQLARRATPEFTRLMR